MFGFVWWNLKYIWESFFKPLGMVLNLKTSLLGLMALFALTVHGQTNFIRNPGFEDGNSSFPDNTGQLGRYCSKWHAYRDFGASQDGTSDWLDNVPGKLRGSVNCVLGGPSTTNQAPFPPINEGTHFAGIIREIPGQIGEGIQQRMTRKLRTGYYELGFDYLLPCDTKSYAITIYLGRNKNQLAYLAAQVHIPTQNVGNWDSLNVGFYVPPQFNNDFDWIVILNDGDPAPMVSGQTGAYIYLDDFGLFEGNCSDCAPQGLISWNQTIPYDFSPNNDGIADTFFVENINNATYFEIECWDRWGAMVHNEVGFEPNGFQNHTIKWDGREDSNNQLLASPNTIYMVITLGNCNAEIQFQRSVSYCLTPACDYGPHDTVLNYVPPLFGLESPPTHYRNLDLYGGVYYGNHHWYACDTIFVGGANSRRTPYFIAGSGSHLEMTASDAIEIVQGDDVDIRPGADVDLLPGQVSCCPELRMMNPVLNQELQEDPNDQLFIQAGLASRTKDHSIAEIESSPVVPDAINLIAFPNPSNGVFHLELEIPAETIGSLVIYDIHLRETGKVFADVALPVGIHFESIDLNSYPKGIYFLQLQTTEHQSSLKLIKH